MSSREAVGRIGPLVGSIVFAVFLGPSARAQPADGPGIRFVDVDGHAVRVQALGLDKRRATDPVLVFEAGATQSLDVWARVLPQVADLAPVVAYDRAGLGRSAWDGRTPTPAHVWSRLRRVLQQVGAAPPYVLVGYSWGGALVRFYAGYHPRDVAGLVFVDPGPIVTQAVADNLAPFDAIGAGRAGYDAYWSAFGGIFTKSPPAVRAEFEVFRGLMDQEVTERDLLPAPDVPVVVIVAAKYLPLPLQLPYDPRAHFEADVRHRVKMLQEWALPSSRGALVVSNQTTHAIPREEPELIVWAIRRVLATPRPR